MKIYTKTGDEGETGLLGGARVSKQHPVIQVTGELDEINCQLGAVLAEELPQEMRDWLLQIQHDLFDLGSQVAASESESSRAAAFPAARVQELENWIDQLDQRLPALRQFILPGGGRAGGQLHLARAVCRRAERQWVVWWGGDLSAAPAVRQPLHHGLIYLNRLSDLLFVMARWVNLKQERPETPWDVGRQSQATSSGSATD